MLLFGGKGSPEMEPLAARLLEADPGWRVIAVCGDNPGLAAKLSAMRCFKIGSAKSTTSSIDGAKRPSSSARARTASISAWLARGLGPQAISLAVSPPSDPGRAERTSERIASTTDSPTGSRRTRRCAAIRSSAVIAGFARLSSAPVVSNRIFRSASRSG